MKCCNFIIYIEIRFKVNCYTFNILKLKISKQFYWNTTGLVDFGILIKW